jgi:hypothetical protein
VANGELSTIHGVSIGSLATAVGVWTGVITLVTWLIRTRVPMRKMKLEADEKLRDDLMERLREVESAADKRVQALEAKLEANDADCDAKLAVLRHRVNNVTTCLDAILLLIEAAPDKAAEHVGKIKEMRARQEVAEATEKATLGAAKITAAKVSAPTAG